MSNQTVFNAAYNSLEKLVQEYLEALEGIPDDDLNHWKPAAEQNGGGEMNALAPMSVHTATAGTWMIVHQVFGKDFPREREQEFAATASRKDIDTLFATMLSRFKELIASDSDVDLAALPPSIRPAIPDWDRMAWLFHAIDHTALHLGHAQITRQVWLAERGNQASSLSESS